MSERIELQASPTNLKMLKGDVVESDVTIYNRGKTVDQFTISVEGLDPAWYSLPVSSVALFPSDKDNVKIIIRFPEIAGTGDRQYQFKVKATSQENPAEFAIINMMAELGSQPKPILSLLPERLSGRKGTYQISVTNPGIKETRLKFKASNKQNRLRFSFSTDSLTLATGENGKVDLNVKLNWMALLWGEKTYDFQVVADQPGAGVSEEDLSRIGGQITSSPWYRIFSRLRIPWLSRPPAIKTFEAATDNRREFKLKWLVQRSSRVQIDDSDFEPQGETLVSPTEPKQYTLTATNRFGTARKAVEIKPLPVPQARASEKIRLSLSPLQLKAQAGIVPAQAVVQVQNLSDIVDKFIVDVEGLDESWYSRSASSIALMPQAADQVQVTFHPPKKKGVKAGVYPFAVTIRSQSMANETASVVGQLEVLPSMEFKAKAHPFRVTAMKKGSFLINLANTGVSDVTIALEATDLDEGLKFQIKPDRLTLGAWNTVEVPLMVRPKRGSFIGQLKRYDTTITATAEGCQPQIVNCEFNHKPLMASSKPIWRMVKAVIALVIVGVALYYIFKLGGGWAVLRENPQVWFNNVISTVEGWFVR